MASTSEIRNGLTINYSNDIYTVVEFLHVKPGKGPAFVRTKMKSLTNGKVIDQTFPSGHKIDIVRIERRKFQYLYNDDMGYHFMDNSSYEQVTLQEDFIANPKFLKESMDVDVLFNSQTELPLIMELPPSIEVAITYTEPGLKGDTATNASKPATTETGAEIRVPLFINEGDIVRIDTSNGNYMERVKS